MANGSGTQTSRDVTRQLGFLLRVAQVAVWRDLVATFAPFGIKPQQYAALTTIERSPGLTLEALARALRIKPPNLVATVDDLVSRSLVRRDQGGANRRGKLLQLTEAGGDFLQRLKEADAVHETELMRILGPERLARLLGDLSTLSDFSSAVAATGAAAQDTLVPTEG